MNSEWQIRILFIRSCRISDKFVNLSTGILERPRIIFFYSESNNSEYSSRHSGDICIHREQYKPLYYLTSHERKSCIFSAIISFHPITACIIPILHSRTIMGGCESCAAPRDDNMRGKYATRLDMQMEKEKEDERHHCKFRFLFVNRSSLR